ncbi:MAG: BatD family protein [Ferruginibacter sp.]
MRSVLHRLFLLFSVTACNAAMAQVKFTATLSPNIIGRSEYTQLDLTVTNGNGTPQILAPSLNDFIIVGGPSTMTNFQNVNGVSSTSFTQSYVLKPKTTGKFIIGSATAILNAVEMRSNPVSLQVSSQAQGNSKPGNNNPFSLFNQSDPFEEQQAEIPYEDYILHKGENVTDKVRKNIFIRVETNKNSCYVGEPIVATYKLYTRLKSESDLVQNPSFNGFSVIDLQQPDISNYTVERLNGKEYYVYTIRKAQLYPLQAGQLELEAAEVENNVRFIKEEYLKSQHGRPEDIYRDFAMANIPPAGIDAEKVSVKSNPVTVTVKPLPEQKKPASFKGAVGNFEIKAVLEKNNFTTDDAGKLNIAVMGSGNMQLITAPDINWPQGIEAFESVSTDELSKTTVPVTGTKYFSYPFTAGNPGSYTIQPVELSYFDATTNSYKTIQTEPLSFTVIKGNGRPSDSVTVVQPGKEKFFNHFFSNRWIIIVPIILLVFTGLFFWVRNENKKDDLAKAKAQQESVNKELNKNAEALLLADQADPLESVKECLEKLDSKNFYACLNSCLREFLSKKLNIPFEELSKKQIAEKMDRKGFSNDISIQLQQLMDEVEWQLYTSSSEEEKMQDIYERADELIQRFKLS